MMKEVFNYELNYIKNKKYKESLILILDMIPEYFYEVPASSTGKYHPTFALGYGGLLRHTKVATRIAYELLQNNSLNNFTDKEKDLIIISIILHDTFKLGKVKEKYTRIDHPLLVAEFLRENQEKFNFTYDELKFICDGIASHMGEWNKDYNGNEVLPLPNNKYQRFIHMCDYLSSKRFLDVKFDSNNNIIG